MTIADTITLVALTSVASGMLGWRWGRHAEARAWLRRMAAWFPGRGA